MFNYSVLILVGGLVLSFLIIAQFVENRHKKDLRDSVLIVVCVFFASQFPSGDEIAQMSLLESGFLFLVIISAITFVVISFRYIVLDDDEKTYSLE